MSFDPIEFLEEAVQTPSHENVGEMRNLVVEVLRENDEDVKIDNAGNIVSSKGKGEPHLVLNTHIDTVPPHVEFDRDRNKIYGRGSCDAKGPLSAILYAYLNSDPRGKLTLALTPDEETTSTGAHYLVHQSRLDPDAVIVGEPTNLDVCNSSRGRFSGTITVKGETSHASQPDTGVNAIKSVGKVNKILENFDEGEEEHPSLGSSTLQPTIIEGGSAKNVLAEEVRITFDRRSLPGETAKDFIEMLEKTLEKELDPVYEVSVKPKQRENPFPEAFHTPDDSHIVEAFRDSGVEETRSFGAAAESSTFAKITSPVIFGPGNLDDAHSPDEYVQIEEVRKAGEILENAVEEFFKS